jgi:hypothetical protein
MQAGEFLGYWWLPGDETQMVPGILRTTAEGDCLLEVNGVIGQAGPTGVDAQHEVIHGISGSKYLTLLHCIQTQLHVGFPTGHNRQDFFVETALIGANLRSDELVFNEMDVYLDHLYEFAGKSGLRPEADASGAKSILYSPPSTIAAALDDQTDLHLHADVATGGGIGAASFSEYAYFRVKSEQPVALHDLQYRVFPALRGLITFACDRPVGIDRVLLRTLSRFHQIGDRQIPVSIEFVRAFIQPPSDHDVELRLTPDQVLFTLPDVTGTFHTLARRWMDISSRYGPALDILTGTMYSQPRYVDNRFLLMTQAAEAYHRLALPEGRVSAESMAHYAAVMAACPGADKEWLTLKLRHATEPSLRARLAQMVRKAKPAVVGVVPPKSDFAKRVSDARNLYTHQGAARGPDAPTNLDVHRLAETLTWTLKLCLLRDIGFTPTQCRQLVERNSRYRHLATFRAL